MLYYSHMAGFEERLSAMKGKQEVADQLKKEQAEKAVEAAQLEREANRSELAAERDTVMVEFAQAEQTANEAREAIAQADAFAEQQGENLDPEAKAEIDAMKVEAGEAQQKFEELKNRLDGLNTEIFAFEESGESQETFAEATTEVSQGEASTTEEAPQAEAEQAPDTTGIEEVDDQEPKIIEKPSIPPLPPKNVEKSPEPTDQSETPTVEASQEEAPESTEKAINSVEAAENDRKQKAFDKLRAQYDKDLEEKANDPENPLNKISAALIKDKEAFSKIVSGAGYGNLDRYTVRYAGVQQDSLEKALPNMLDKGMISPEEYASYLAMTSYEGNGNSLNMPRLNRLIAETPVRILYELIADRNSFEIILDEWYKKTQTEIKKEKGLPRSDAEKVLKLVSSVERFSEKEEASEYVSSAVDTYMKSYSNISRLGQEDGSYPVLENLYEAGFSDQADKILEKGFSDGSIHRGAILEYQKKGYITEQKAKDMYEKRGLLE